MGDRTAARPTSKVLLVDDDEDFRHSTALILAQHGYSCVEVASASQARAVLNAEQGVAAVLCDITMPGESGIDLLPEFGRGFP